LFERVVEGRWLSALVEQARDEDLRTGDVTTQLMGVAEREARGVMRAREAGRLAGLRLLKIVGAAYDGQMTVKLLMKDGDGVKAGQAVAEVSGVLRSVAAAERVMLNFVGGLSGVASLTSKYVEAVRGTGAKIFDTRKTMPGYRGLAKWAVRCGGGCCHRMGLWDAVLVKDNHVAGMSTDEMAERVRGVVEGAKKVRPTPGFVEVEVDTLEQLEAVLGCGVDVMLLDNFDVEELREAVRMRDRAGPRNMDVELEASGGVELNNVRAIAETGVERIAVGAMTHSAEALDVGMDVMEN
jgi:nicotinate-nucleotide pyrophosphorylase (carboxylating)